MNQIQLKTLREQIQENIRCSLEGAPDKMLDAACQSVVDAFKPVINEDAPTIRVLYDEMAVIPTGSDYLLDLINKEIETVCEGDAIVLISTHTIHEWRVGYGKDDIKENEHRDRLYHYLTAVLNKFEDDEREEPAYIMFTN